MGINVEAEYTFPTRIDGVDDPDAFRETTLARGPLGFTLKAESKKAYVDASDNLHRYAPRDIDFEESLIIIPEVTSGIMRVLDEERNRPSIQESMHHYRSLEHALHAGLQTASEPRLPLCLPGEWTPTSDGREATLGQALIGGERTAHVHYNVGIPLASIPDALTSIHSGTWRSMETGIPAREILHAAIAFGQHEAAEYFRFQSSSDQGGGLPARQVSAACSLLYVATASISSWQHCGGSPKSYAAILPRQSPSELLASCTPEARNHLANHVERIIENMNNSVRLEVNNLNPSLKHPVARPTSLPLRGDDRYSVKDFLESGLKKTRPEISMRDAFGDMFTLPSLDTNEGRTRPMVVLEVRSYGGRHLTATQVAENVSSLAAMARSAYDHDGLVQLRYQQANMALAAKSHPTPHPPVDSTVRRPTPASHAAQQKAQPRSARLS
ncbi:hypothetical protein ACH4C6_34875 [Streptomyces sp. NPDC017943]|uniref:hypothetical protein n=1 Tax=Streptomyces sp. NPDC017943 TaxID=3365019 RepID=UPI0037A69442